MLVALEGIDGSGKTTQAALLASRLRKLGLEVVESKEPTNGTWGRKIRESAVSGRLPFDEELTAFINDRQDHLRETVTPALESGKIVVLDRYFYSTLAYQGARIADWKSLDARVRDGVIAPDMALYLDIDPLLSLPRINARGEKPDNFEKIDNLIKVREIFLDICRSDSAIWKIKADCAQEQVHRTILNIIADNTIKNNHKIYGLKEILISDSELCI